MKINTILKTTTLGLLSLALYLLTAQTSYAAIDACLPTPPPPACNATCTPGAASCPQDCPNCTSGATGYTCTSVPACNSSCTTPADCTGAKDSCTSCIGGTCRKEPACNSSCTTPADCTGAKDSCTSCINNKCQVEPTPVPACNSSCTTPADCTGARDGCTTCTANKCTAPPTLTPTPTPDPFNDDMCKCDGLETATAIEQGKPITVTAFGKVLATDDKYAKISTIKFSLLKGNGNLVTKVLETEPLAAQKIPSASDIVRYSASWTFDIPQPIEKGVEYRIATTTKCAKNITAAPFNRTVMAATDENTGFFGAIANFFAGLFSADTGSNQGDTPSQNTGQTQNSSREEQLKLGTFEPLKTTVLENNNCNLMRFRFDEL